MVLGVGGFMNEAATMGSSLLTPSPPLSKVIQMHTCICFRNISPIFPSVSLMSLSLLQTWPLASVLTLTMTKSPHCPLLRFGNLASLLPTTFSVNQNSSQGMRPFLVPDYFLHIPSGSLLKRYLHLVIVTLLPYYPWEHLAACLHHWFYLELLSYCGAECLWTSAFPLQSITSWFPLGRLSKKYTFAIFPPRPQNNLIKPLF